MRRKGKITTWNDDKGFGFITPNDGGAPIFVHVKAFGNRNQRPAINQTVTYSVEKDRLGRARAKTATSSGSSFQLGSKRTSDVLAVLLSCNFLSIAGISAFATTLPLLIPIVYVVLSITTFIIYAIDKSAASNNRWRTSEATLHFWALAGGWPGALLAQQFLRHKSKKKSFRRVFWITVLLNCVAFGWLHTSDGKIRLEQLLTLIQNFMIV